MSWEGFGPQKQKRRFAGNWLTSHPMLRQVAAEEIDFPEAGITTYAWRCARLLVNLVRVGVVSESLPEKRLYPAAGSPIFLRTVWLGLEIGCMRIHIFSSFGRVFRIWPQYSSTGFFSMRYPVVDRLTAYGIS